MMEGVAKQDWKSTIRDLIKERDKREHQPFLSLIQAHNKLFESVDSVRTKNLQLTLETERLKHENLELSLKTDSGGGGGVIGAERVRELEQKLFKLQEELTELHRKKGENSQRIIDLNNILQEKEREIQSKDGKLSDMESNIRAMVAANKSLEGTIMELEATNQMLKDEQQALQLAFTSLEEKFRKIHEENNELVTRWMEQKALMADKLNEENDVAFRMRQAKMQRELAEAAKEQVTIKPDRSHQSSGSISSNPPVPFCLSVSLPTKALCKLDAHEGEVNAIRWSYSGRLFATGGTDRKIKLWEYKSGRCETVGTLLGSNAGVMSLDVNTEETLILGASNDFASRVWSLQDHRLRHTLTGHSGKVLAAKFLGDSNKVVSGSHDRTLKIWDLVSRACIKTIFAGSSCNDLVTSDGFGSNIISGHFDKRIRFWDTRSESSANEISLQGRVTSLDLSPDRNYLLSCSRDDTLKIIDLRMNQVTGTFCTGGFHVGCDWSRAVFSPDGEYVTVGGGDGTVFIWDIKKNKVERQLKEHNHSVVACSWHPGGSMILSCDKQKKVILWSDF
ncbi:autophagy-related protein 16-1 isoform X2 [Lingula anatina]|uniref:Autophagy-related protein 16-1 isoform X2 n=1 Tax=Lingula anatina TaxID=7574 RepID=A0A1S3JYX6_LINAN|nr:autophagy-related protein 16-1 isoform X2 [Lingula anatina]|eukprot:XP_013415279.1 autophagy-related protein 16-1 isoform X2 [Lingula anatina]